MTFSIGSRVRLTDKARARKTNHRLEHATGVVHDTAGFAITVDWTGPEIGKVRSYHKAIDLELTGPKE